ncbi:hypothetical protein M634_10950 [Vibrio parahaemolyticus O1:Kuk str. FDA_R31]|uniref:hypothetical protein n=1 Tax=Vibrio parahaemolyticus TaxID=670 RepID=UPI00035909DD|nr:hypothetical protein [Vibrio parahaemolyticus]AGQ92264.1 hypothetical protein M634_10950 [Vibrio parahaemolyticus O1:Kuk str. FDA_R31]
MVHLVSDCTHLTRCPKLVVRIIPQFGKVLDIQFKDRFTGSTFKLDSAMMKLFCELTVANELELVYSSEEFKLKYGAELFELFQGMDSYLSTEARKAYKSALSNLA